MKALAPRTINPLNLGIRIAIDDFCIDYSAPGLPEYAAVDSLEHGQCLFAIAGNMKDGSGRSRFLFRGFNQTDIVSTWMAVSLW